jgi:hypothetical protein
MQMLSSLIACRYMHQAKETKTATAGSSANEEVRLLGRGDYFGDGALDG